MEMFEKLASQIQNLNHDVALHHLVTTMPPRPFVNNLCKKPTLNLDELRYRATKFMQLEELREFHNQAWSKNNLDKGRGKERSGSHHFPKQNESRTPSSPITHL